MRTRSDALESLLAGVQPASATFKVPLPGGKEVEFNRPRKYSEFRDVVVATDEWAKEVRESHPESWAEYLREADDDTLKKVYEMSRFVLSPALSQLDFLILACEEGALFLGMYLSFLSEVDSSSRWAGEQAVQAGKAESPQTPIGDASLRSAGTSGADIHES